MWSEDMCLHGILSDHVHDSTCSSPSPAPALALVLKPNLHLDCALQPVSFGARMSAVNPHKMLSGASTKIWMVRRPLDLAWL